MATLRDFGVRTGAGEGCTITFTTPTGIEAFWQFPDDAIVAVTNTHLAVAVGSGRLTAAFGASTDAPWRNLGMVIAMCNRGTGTEQIECLLVPLDTEVVWPPLRHWLTLAENAARDFAATSTPASKPSTRMNPCGFENIQGELRLVRYGAVIAAEKQPEAFVIAVITYVALANNPQSLLRELGVNASREPLPHSQRDTALALLAA